MSEPCSDAAPPAPACWLRYGEELVDLAQVGGELAASAIARSASVVMERGATQRLSRFPAASLVAVGEGALVVSCDTGARDRSGDPRRRVVVATGAPGTLLSLPAPDDCVEALTACRLIVVPADSLRVLLAIPLVAEAITGALFESLQERQTTIRNCAYVRHVDRVREKLLQLARLYGRAVPGGVRVDFPLTQQLLADMIGSARETVSLALSHLVRNDFLHRANGAYVLRVSPAELGRRSEGAAFVVLDGGRHAA